MIELDIKQFCTDMVLIVHKAQRCLNWLPQCYIYAKKPIYDASDLYAASITDY